MRLVVPPKFSPFRGGNRGSFYRVLLFFMVCFMGRERLASYH